MGFCEILTCSKFAERKSWLGLTPGYVARDIFDTFSAVLEILERVVKSLPSWEIYIQLYKSSKIQLLRPALVEIYSDIVLFGLRAIKLFSRSSLRELFLNA